MLNRFWKLVLNALPGLTARPSRKREGTPFLVFLVPRLPPGNALFSTPFIVPRLPPGNAFCLLTWLVFHAAVGLPLAQAADADVVEYTTAVASQDVWQAPQREILRGEVRQFDAEQLTMVDSDGTGRSIAAAQVVSVAPGWRSEAAAEAHQAFVARNYPRVQTAVPQALKSNLVQWQQRMLIAELVDATAAVGQIRQAGVYFVSLAKSQPPHMLYADMPLCWGVAEPDAALRGQAQSWLASDDQAARLLGASWLLLGEQSAEARRALQQLQASDNAAIAQLSTIQGWRLTPPPQTMSELAGWLERRDRLLPPLQLGPTEFLADRLMRIGEHDLAIGQWMRIASQHADRPHRVRQALQSAAALLQRNDRALEAQRLQAWIDKLAPSD